MENRKKSAYFVNVNPKGKRMTRLSIQGHGKNRNEGRKVANGALEDCESQKSLEKL